MKDDDSYQGDTSRRGEGAPRPEKRLPRRTGISSMTFALETSRELADSKEDSASSAHLLDAAFGQAQEEPRGYVLYLRDFSTPSTLIEQSLKNAGFYITLVRDVPALREEVALGVHGAVLMDSSLPIFDRISLLGELNRMHRPLPVMMIFEPDAAADAKRAQKSGATECVVRDGHGEYLLAIPELMGRIVKRPVNQSTHELPNNHREGWDDITDEVDLRAIAAEYRGAAGEAQDASLVVLAGPDVGTIVQLSENVCVIGRDPSCNLRLRDDSISRYHASIKRHKSGVVTIKDLNSTNGIFVGGKREDIAELKDGDKILFGKDTLVKYQLQDVIDKAFQEDLYMNSTRDGLTGVLNRRHCMERTRVNMSYARRHLCPVSVLMMDIDHFKTVNDTYGHSAGDLVLKTVANLAAGTIRTEDVIGRYGGEEFILFTLGTGAKGAETLAERLRSKIEAETMLLEDDPRSVRVTVSIGVASAKPGEDYDLEKLIAEADANLYAAKNGGRNRVVATGEDAES